MPRCSAIAEHGRWSIAPVEDGARVTRRYRGHTLILETRIETAGGAVTVVDFMPPRGRNSDVVRIVRGERGRVAMRTELILRFDYGRTVPWVTRLPDGTMRAIAGPDLVTLHTAVALRGEDLTTVGDFEVAAGESVTFVLTHGSSHRPPPRAVDPESSLEHTERFWAEWAARARPDGEWDDAVMRSLVTLKALTFATTGGMVAAPTTSLPEELGGSRNWDYRFCWLRDATLTLLALMNAGFYSEARPGATGCCAPPPARRRSCRSCTAWPASGGSPRARSPGCPATRRRGRCGSATPRTASCSSTCSAR